MAISNHALLLELFTDRLHGVGTRAVGAGTAVSRNRFEEVQRCELARLTLFDQRQAALADVTEVKTLQRVPQRSIFRLSKASADRRRLRAGSRRLPELAELGPQSFHGVLLVSSMASLGSTLGAWGDASRVVILLR